MSDSAKFDFYEKVVVASARPELEPITGKLGAILGRAQNDDGKWSYAIHVYGEDEGWSVYEAELHSTGEFDRRETFYDGTSIRVSEDGELLE